MFFSKVIVRIHDMEPKVLSDLAYGAFSQGAHQAIWRLFKDPHVTQRDFLYRYENEDGIPVFYIVSQRKPIPSDRAWEVLSKPYAPQVKKGERLAFSLKANPVRAGKSEKEGKYVRHDVVMAAKTQLKKAGTPRRLWPLEAELIQDECVEWLKSREERCGFQISPNEVRADGYRRHHYSRGDRGKLQFSTVDYAGLLTVEDPEKFVETLFRGIGHGKAFGCGMLMVRRV